MLRVSQIMTKDVLTVEPETTLRDAAELFMAKHISGAPVCRGDEVVGVISAGDIIDFTTTTPEETLEEAGHAPPSASEAVERQDAPAASFYMDLAMDNADVDDRMSEPAFTERRMLDEHVVEEAMSRDPISVSPQDTVLEAAEAMRRRGIHRVLVLDDGKLAGIVSTLDVARAVAERKLTAKQYVFNKDSDFEERDYDESR